MRAQLLKIPRCLKIGNMTSDHLAITNQKSNPREFQYMSILLALAYHGRATYETFTINR